MAQLRYSPFSPSFFSPHSPSGHLLPPTLPKFPLLPNTSLIASQSTSPIQFFYPTSPNFHHHIPFASGGDAGGGSSGGGGGGGGAGRGGSDDDHHEDHDSSSSSSSAGDDFGPIGAFLEGWRSRVAADPQFPFKVLMEELVGVTACVIGDMASRPNFGLNELDFVFSTLVVGSILNFVLMYLLAPTAGPAGAAAAVQSSLPSIFAGCPPSHMFEPGSYGLLSRLGTFVYKGTLFAAVGFAAGLVGTALSNGLITMRKKMDPNFETLNKPPPTVLNAFTWALHMGANLSMGLSSYSRRGFLPWCSNHPWSF